MSIHFTESQYENAIIQLLQGLGYQHICGYEATERDYSNPLFMEELVPALRKINPGKPESALDEAVRKIQDLGSGSLVQKNKTFTDYLQNGVTVRYTVRGEERSDIVRLVDFNQPGRNSFIVANQWTIIEHAEKRPDIILFINGLPLVVVELKSPSREETNESEAYRQLRNYMRNDIPSLFAYNAVCVISNQALSKAGTITSSEDRFMEWKTTDGKYENKQHASFETFFTGLFQPARFLDILKNFICFNESEDATYKILAGYHQYFAVRRAIESTRQAAQVQNTEQEFRRKGGVFWHTQGSGKSLSMVFYAHLLQETLESPTIVVLTDRNDLDDQLYGLFCRCKGFLRQTPLQASSRKHLRRLLEDRQANGIIFTTMQKFEEYDAALSTRSNIVVMADEAHRSQYGLSEQIKTRQDASGTLTVRTVLGAARRVQDSLPNAIYIGFTGTPISAKDRSTREVFGDYIDIYDMTQAVADGATRPVYYESRVVKLNLNQEVLEQIDQEYELLAQNTDEYVIEKSKKELARMEAILGAEQTIASLVDDILEHYETYRANLLTGKAMIVAYSRGIAMKIYHRILQLRPDWGEKVAVVMTHGNNDPEEWGQIIGGKKHKEELAVKFKDNDSPLKIAIVVDMWLTGFDVPSLATMYVFKPMQGHNLMQAIARVNRVFNNKEGGLIVDYIGIASALKQAMNDYTKADQEHFGDTDIRNTAYPKFQEELSICHDFFYGFDYSGFMHGSDLLKAQLITGGVNFLLDKTASEHDKDEKDRTQALYIKHALLLRQALTLCSSLATQEERFEAAFFEAVRTILVHLSSSNSGRKFSLNEVNQRINELLKQSIQSDGVLNLFSDIHEEFSLFDPKFLDEVARMKHKNLAIELLRKLLNDKVSIYKRTNLVKAELFSERLQKIMNSYVNGLITNEEVIEQLLQLANDIATAQQEAQELGLTDEELAFYDALTKPQAIKDFYEHEELIAMTRDLTEMLRKNRTIDWQQKEAAQANMRVMIKRLLKKHKYPPEDQANAIEIVLDQCKLWVENAAL